MVPFTQMDAARRRISWLAQVALILNHSTRATRLGGEEEDLSWLTKPLVEQASQLTSSISPATSSSETSALMRILIDGLRDVVENSPPNSPQMEHLLIGVCNIWRHCKTFKIKLMKFMKQKSKKEDNLIYSWTSVSEAYSLLLQGFEKSLNEIQCDIPLCLLSQWE